MRLPIFFKLLLLFIAISGVLTGLVGGVALKINQDIRDSASNANQDIATMAMNSSKETLSAEKRAELETRTLDVTKHINDSLLRIQADTAELAQFATFLYAHPEAFTSYPFPSTYKYLPDDRFASVVKNENSWMMVMSPGIENGKVPPETLDEIYLTEYLDPLFHSIAANNPNAAQLYINTPSQITRGMQFSEGKYDWVNAAEQFAEVEDLTLFDFYKLADKENNPEKTTRWVDVYYDPAGLGWIISSIAPVYKGEQLMGVVGIDLTLSRIIEDILDVKIQDTGFAFLLSGDGQVIAAPPRGRSFLGMSEESQSSEEGDTPIKLTEHKVDDANFQAIVDKMITKVAGVGDYKSDRQYIWQYRPIETTGWSVGIVVPFEEVIAPAIKTNEQITVSQKETAASLVQNVSQQTTNGILTVAVLFLASIPLLYIFSRTFSNPIQQLKEGSQRIGSGELSYRIQIKTKDEIEDLAVTFNQMSNDLQAKIDEIETANTELRQLDQLKSQFISIASHELRTPLIAIQGYVDLLKEGKSGDINSEQLKMLDTVSRNTHRLARLVTDLLDVSRIEEKRLVLYKNPLNLGQIVEEISAELQSSITKRKQTLTLQIPNHLPLVNGDNDRLAQVITNLLGNAIKYTPDGGKIEIALTLQNEGKEIDLTVKDNGIGIALEHQKRIFSRFYEVGAVQHHKTGKDQFMSGGTGLGLSIVQGIVEGHEGKIWVESELDKGTTFHVLLPALENQFSAEHNSAQIDQQIYRYIPYPHEETVLVPSSKRPKILVVDDEPDTIEVVQRILAEYCDIETALTSATGLKAAFTIAPDLILLDAWMAGISGYDVCRTLKRNPLTKSTPIIIFTAAAQKEDEEQAKNSGADGYLIKPFKQEKLIELVDQFKLGQSNADNTE